VNRQVCDKQWKQIRNRSAQLLVERITNRGQLADTGSVIAFLDQLFLAQVINDRWVHCASEFDTRIFPINPYDIAQGRAYSVNFQSNVLAFRGETVAPADFAAALGNVDQFNANGARTKAPFDKNVERFANG